MIQRAEVPIVRTDSDSGSEQKLISLEISNVQMKGAIKLQMAQNVIF